MSRPVLALALAGMLVLAGCGGTTNPTSSPTPTRDGTTTPTGSPGTATATPGDGGGDGSTDVGKLTFYVSDEKNAIEDFEHLNVTITKVGIHRKKPDDGATPTPTATTTATPTPAAGNTPTPTPTPTATGTPAPTETPSDDDAGEEDDDFGGKAWVTYEVDRRTVDLTELQGDRATRLGVFDAPAGEYDQVFLFVDEVEGTLKGGQRVNVKLPSERLKLNEQFTIGDGEEVDFVFDVSVFKAGKSGKYILKPVATESGTDVPIDEAGNDDENEDGDNDRNGEGEPSADETETPEPTETSEQPGNSGNADGGQGRGN